jgi:hypothetical protein
VLTAAAAPGDGADEILGNEIGFLGVKEGPSYCCYLFEAVHIVKHEDLEA